MALRRRAALSDRGLCQGYLLQHQQKMLPAVVPSEILQYLAPATQKRGGVLVCVPGVPMEVAYGAGLQGHLPPQGLLAVAFSTE